MSAPLRLVAGCVLSLANSALAGSDAEEDADNKHLIDELLADEEDGPEVGVADPNQTWKDFVSVQPRFFFFVPTPIQAALDHPPLGGARSLRASFRRRTST
jgi:hypothetical protein